MLIIGYCCNAIGLKICHILVSRLVAVHEFQPIMIVKITLMFDDRRNDCCSR